MLRCINKIITILLSGVSLSATGGCSMIYDYDTCPDSFIVQSDWKYAPQASPESMAYLFFPDKGEGCWRYDFPGRQGGEAPIPDGKYHVLSFNDDSNVTIISDPDCGYRGIKAYTCCSKLYESLGGGPDSLGNQQVSACPTQLWCQAIDSMQLSANGVYWSAPGSKKQSFSPQKILTVYPRPTMASYSYEINDVSGLDGVRRMCAAISGMASELSLCDMTRAGAPVTLPLKAERSGETDIYGEFLTVGTINSSTVPNRLLLYVWLTDGRKFSYSFDVTGQARNAPDPMNVHIKVSGIELPQSTPSDSDGAFDVNVDGWVEIIIDINA